MILVTVGKDGTCRKRCRISLHARGTNTLIYSVTWSTDETGGFELRFEPTKLCSDRCDRSNTSVRIGRVANRTRCSVIYRWAGKMVRVVGEQGEAEMQFTLWLTTNRLHRRRLVTDAFVTRCTSRVRAIVVRTPHFRRKRGWISSRIDQDVFVSIFRTLITVV